METDPTYPVIRKVVLLTQDDLFGAGAPLFSNCRLHIWTCDDYGNCFNINYIN